MIDPKTNRIGEIGVTPVKLREAKLKKNELEKIPKPKKEITAKSWLEEKSAAYEQERRDIARGLIQAAQQDVSSIFNEEVFKDAIDKRLSGLPIERRNLILPTIADLLEETLFSVSLSAWENRTQDVDKSIRNLESRLPPKFSMELVNRHKDYPSGRIVYVDNEPCDKWLSDILGSKKPIPFNTFDRWLEKLEQAYAVYLEEHRREQEAKQPPLVEVPAQPQPSDEIPQSVLQAEFYGIGKEKEDISLRGRINKIYKGGR